jgi:hypothetical protein
MKTRLEQHLKMMATNEITFTVGISDFYKGNGGKDKVWKHLGIKSNWTWSKRLEYLYPGQFMVKENRLFLTNDAPPINTKKKANMSKTNKRTQAQDLGTHIEAWIERVEHFNGTAKKRSTPSSVKKNARGKACPTCQQQMVEQKSSPHKISAEHIIPLSLGGDNTVSGSFPQVVAMCHACNTARNQLVLSVKENNRSTMVEFLIRQVYDTNISKLNDEYFSTFKKFYFSLTGTEIKLKSSRNELLIVGGFMNHRPSTLMQIAMEHLEDIPSRIVLFIHQKDSHRINLNLWSKYTDEIRLIPNGKENLQCSVILEASGHEGNTVACLMDRSQSSGVFETLLDKNEIRLLDASVVAQLPVSKTRSKFSKFLPWNWFVRNQKQEQSGSFASERPKSKPEAPPTKVSKKETSLQLPKTTTHGLPNIESDRSLAKMGTENHTPSQPKPNSPNTLEWANDEQLKIISDLKERLVSDIYEKKRKGSEFTVLGLASTYKPYGGSAALKKQLGFPVNTKIRNMFSKLFGDVFVFTGEAPLLVINTLIQPDDIVIHEPKQDKGLSFVEIETSVPIHHIEKKPVGILPVEELGLEQELHIIENFRNQIIEELKSMETSKLSMSDIRTIATAIKIERKMSWSLFHAHFGLDKRVQNWEAHFSTMLEMAGLEYTKESIDEVDWYHFSENMLPLPSFDYQRNSSTKTESRNLHSTEWASHEQQMIIDEVRVSLQAAIQKLEERDKRFEMKHLGQIYKPYGGSLAFKKKMGLLSSTKIKDVFSKLFGDEFTFSGKQPLWIISCSEERLGLAPETEE